MGTNPGLLVTYLCCPDCDHAFTGGDGFEALDHLDQHRAEEHPDDLHLA